MDLLVGMVSMTSIMASLFFIRFWRNTRDRFFLWFAMSFLIDAANRIYTDLSGSLREDAPQYYLVRLVAYSLILWAIAEKNGLLRRLRTPKGTSREDRSSGA